MKQASTQLETDVLIIGGGPVGLASAIFLGKLGVKALLLERRSTTSTHPRGHIVNTRSMEILRGLGLESDVKSISLPPERYRGVVFRTRLAGDELGRIETRGDIEHDCLIDSYSPTMKTSCPQDVLEPVLRQHAEAQSGVDVRFGVQVNALREHASGVTATLVDLPEGVPYEVSARYVIAADGARSRTRDWLGIAMRGDASMGNQMGVYLKADLWPWVHDLPYLLLWIYNRDTTGVFISLDGRHRWTYNFAYDPATQSPEDFTPERCVELIRAAVGAPDLPVEICSVQPWQMQARTVERMRVGRVFLAGDAAHPLPPTGGQGMNTGFGDVQNLAWKLKLVLDGVAPDALLDTYEAERLPTARFNVEQSARNAQKMAEAGLAGILRNDPGVGERVEAPDSGPLRAQLREAIAAQREHFEYNGQTFGYRYVSDAIIDDGLACPAFDVAHYVPNASPGSRAPHLGIGDGCARLSILDLFGGAHFVMLTTPHGKPVWQYALEDAQRAAGFDVRVVSIGAGGDYAADDDTFATLYGIGGTGAVLVRPDGHVAWRSNSPVAQDILAQVLATVLATAQPGCADDVMGCCDAESA
ncbi:FAD-dependent monooxygenase [Paraburkholderia sp. J63]|uniref:FAD-dependent monooxygenase n=1 Tax=Paraburkholderia sp. J63 TaxID=2805434 RepID=UPI002ABE88BC|nr:FAD-dependent monooxygenase [Paraburkholderia sp. J63]